MRKLASTLVFTFSVFALFAQTDALSDFTFEMKNYDWEEKPTPTVITEEEAKAPLVISKDFLVKEYLYFSGIFFEVSTFHKKKKLNKKLQNIYKK